MAPMGKASEPFRLLRGGLIDRGRALAFSFDGRSYVGRPGDTLASALLANGVHLVGRSFKYHRPRGVFGAGVEEPNAMVELRQGARTGARSIGPGRCETSRGPGTTSGIPRSRPS